MEYDPRTMTLEESQVPLTDEVRAACELLGLDPLYAANEGTMLIAVAPDAAEEAVRVLQSVSEMRHATVIGQVNDRGLAAVTIRRLLGTEQPLDEPAGVCAGL